MLLAIVHVCAPFPFAIFQTPTQFEELGFDPRLPKTPFLRQARHGERFVGIEHSGKWESRGLGGMVWRMGEGKR